MDTPITVSRAPEVIAPGSGHHLHFLNHLATIKVHGRDSALSAVEFLCPRGFGPPLHRHEDEDEVFVVLEGRIAVHTGDDITFAEAGGIAYLPHAVPHTFQVHSEQARFVCVSGGHTGPPRFDAMVVALGVEVATPSLPEPGPIDPNRVAEICTAHRIQVLGPPPGPLPA